MRHCTFLFGWVGGKGGGCFGFVLVGFLLKNINNNFFFFQWVKRILWGTLWWCQTDKEMPDTNQITGSSTMGKTHQGNHFEKFNSKLPCCKQTSLLAASRSPWPCVTQLPLWVASRSRSIDLLRFVALRHGHYVCMCIQGFKQTHHETASSVLT